jgi:2-aminophenol/2-amino-5-chlorophenol 1,6-dioxygenase alpha subunit
MNPVVRGYIVPGRPHPLLCPDDAEPWRRLRDAFARVRDDIAATETDLILFYSTQWISVIGHQIQADPEPQWTLVDQEWHELGTIEYRLRMDADFAHEVERCARRRGLHARTVAYRGFPIDTGTVVASKLLNPDNRIPACVFSCNMYADRAETIVWGKSVRDALERQGKRAIAVAVTALSNRMFTRPIEPSEDRISSVKDDEWNRKLLEILAEGRLEDVAQHAREFTSEANGDQRLKAIWWLAALMGQHNAYSGEVFEYQPLVGTGAALVGLTPTGTSAAGLEFDEEDVEVFTGDRDVLSGGDREPRPPTDEPARAGAVHAESAPRPVGAFPHARRVGDLLFVSGMGPRTPSDDTVPGGPVWDDAGNRLEYDVEAQTRAVIENVRTVLEASGSSLDKVIDVQVFLIDMERDFETFNRIYAEYFEDVQATRTTVQIDRLPTPIAVEFKVMAEA